MKKQIQIIPFTDKKDEQLLHDLQRTPLERWMYMWQLIDFSLAFSPTHQLKFFDENDRFITLKRKNAAP